MNKTAKTFKILKDIPPSLLRLGIVLSTIMLVGLILAVIVLIDTLWSEGYFHRDFCLTDKCANNFFTGTAQSFVIAKATFDLGVAIATIGGIFVALLGYLSAARNSALASHIDHLKIFSEYLSDEIKKRDRLSESLFDTLLLYETIFSQSRSGKTAVSDGYKDIINGLNAIIAESNSRCVAGTPGGFSYKEHQRKVREHLATAGITVYTAPRNDYFEMEAQLFSLLHRISQSFCPPGSLPELAPQKYH